MSDTAPPLNGVVLLFDSVRVTTDVPPDTIDAGLNALLMVGAASTVRFTDALGEPAVGVCVVVTPDVALGWTPGVLLVTLKITVQLPFAGIEMPVKLSAVAPAVNVPGAAPQLPVTAPATALMLARVSDTAPPLNGVETLLFDSVRVTTEVPPDWIVVGLNALVMVGVASAVTVRFTVLLTGPAVGVCVVVTPDVVFGLLATLLLVTLKMMVQFPPPGIEIPVKFSAVAPAVNDAGDAPQLPVTAPATALMLARVSDTAPPLNGVVLLFDSVRVTTDVPPDTIDAGLNALLMVGAASTVRFTDALGEPAVGVCVVVTPDVALGWTPGVLLVTLKITVQLPFAGIEMPVKLSAVAPAVNVPGAAPQLPVTAPATALMLARVSDTAPPLNGVEALLFDSVNVTTELPPDWIVVGLNALVMVGDAVELMIVESVAVAEEPAPPPLTVTEFTCGEVKSPPH